MTVRLRVALACFVFIAICAGIAANAWRTQARLSGLAMELYDQAFVTQDFVGRAALAFEHFADKRAPGPVTPTEQKTVLASIMNSLDIGGAGVKNGKTKTVLQRLHAEIAALPQVAAAQLPAAIAQITDDFGRAARRVSNDGLAQRDDAEALAHSARIVLLMVVAAALVGSILTGILLTRAVVRPLRLIAADMSRLCRGDIDVVVSGTQRRDEIGEFSRSLSFFREALLANRALQANSEEMAEMRRMRQVALTSMSEAFNMEVSSQLGSVDAAVATMLESAQKMLERAMRMRVGSANVGQLADGAAANAQAVTSLVRELTESGHEIASVINRSAEATRQMLHEAEQARGLVDELGVVAEGVGSVVALISGIAAQTNLLALNATIEAARAGEAGRGFAVVAGEVKALARQTGQATADIGSRIGAVRSSASRAIALIRTMADRIAAVEQSGGAIASSVQRQGDALGEINTNLVQAATGIADVAAGMKNLDQDVAENDAVSAQVDHAAQDVQKRSGLLRHEIEYFIKATNDAAEWRNYARYDVEMPVRITSPAFPPLEATTVNISRGGVRLHAQVNIPPGVNCTIDGLIAHPLPGRVMDCKDGIMRVQFHQHEEAQARLAQFIEDRFAKHAA